MNSQGIAISLVYPIMKAIVHKGLDWNEFCRFSSFDGSLLQDVEVRIAEEELERLMNTAALFTRDDHFGLRQGHLTDVVDLGILGYVMMHSGKVADALEAYQRYNTILCSGFNLEWEVRGEGVLLRLFLQSRAGRMSRHCMEDMASSLYQLIGKMSSKRIPLHEIQFTHDAPDDTVPYLNVFGRVPAFSGTDNYLLMSKEVLDYPILYSDSKLLELFASIAEETRDKLTNGRVFSDRVFHWMLKCMPVYFPTLQQTAESFRMSTRTLQNKLKEENTSYNDVAAGVRKGLAVGYLHKREYSVAEIAYLLHYSEPSAFQSAFKKWTGLTPGQYRTNGDTISE
ncbi:AraC family transcriptional regulator [Paenibacillus harenae]|uniref:AraC family transcriptional regulator n=1 Tax=Paenibacillus harenae TaxID=306543 RepID=UPI00040AB404|nr:AraC family transcriptional regulator [Paenibacillus harenae]